MVKLPNVSYECLEAIELLLKKNPQERITIFDFLHHPWLQNYQRRKNKKLWPTSYSSDSHATSSLKDTLSGVGDQDDEDRSSDDVDNEEDKEMDSRE